MTTLADTIIGYLAVAGAMMGCYGLIHTLDRRIRAWRAERHDTRS